MRRGAVVGGAAIVAAAVAFPFVPSGAQAQAGVFRTTAAADGMRITYAAPGYLLFNTLADLGAPTAQVLVDGFGNSTGFASDPYPGDTVGGAPGLLKGSGAPEAIPDYPLIVQTSYPSTPDAKNDGGVYFLKANSKELESSSEARASSPTGDTRSGFTQSTSHAVREDSGAETGEAETTAESLEFGPALRIGRVHSRSKVSVSSSGTLTREVEFQVGEMTIAGQSVALTDKGLTLLGSSTPLPASDPLMQILSADSISVHYLAGSEDPDGVVSPALEVTQQQPTPLGPTTYFTYTIGRTSAHAAPGEDVAKATSLGDLGGDLGAADTSNVSSAVGSLASPSAGGGAALSSSTPSASSAAPAARPRARAALASSSAPGVDWGSFYLILVVGAAAALGGAQLIRILAVRLAWMS